MLFDSKFLNVVYITIKARINQNVKTINENGNIRDEIATYEYKFNVVTDEDVAELDETEYELKKFN